MKKLAEEAHFFNALVPLANAFAGTVYTDVINCENYASVCFVLQKGVGTTGTSTITAVPVSTNGASASGTAVGYDYSEITSTDVNPALTNVANTGFTTTAGSNTLVVVEVDLDKIAASGYQYMRLAFVEVAAAAVLGGVLGIMYNPRYAGAGSPTQLV